VATLPFMHGLLEGRYTQKAALFYWWR